VLDQGHGAGEGWDGRLTRREGVISGGIDQLWRQVDVLVVMCSRGFASVANGSGTNDTYEYPYSCSSRSPAGRVDRDLVVHSVCASTATST
jgi:hypothetical protein